MNKYITVDDKTSRDLDDGFSAIKFNMGWMVPIYIACPALSIRVGSEDYINAEKAVETVYRGKTVKTPMLRKELSENELSLLPGSARKALRLDICVSHEGVGELRGIEVVDARNIAKLSHVDANDTAHLKGDTKKWMDNALECSKTLFNRRLKEDSSLDFIDIDKGIYLNEDGQPVEVSAKEVHGQILVQEFMILANKLLTQYCGEKQLPILFRNHQPMSVEDFKSKHPQVYQYYAEELGDTSKFKNVAGKAYYGMINKGHLALNLVGGYSTFTSPLRRFPDLFNSTVLLSHLGMDVVADVMTIERCKAINEFAGNIKTPEEEAFLKRFNAKKIGKRMMRGEELTCNQLSQIFKRTRNIEYRAKAIKLLLGDRRYSISSRPWGEIILNPQPYITMKEQAEEIMLRVCLEQGLALSIHSFLESVNALPSQKLTDEQKKSGVIALMMKAVGVNELPRQAKKNEGSNSSKQESVVDMSVEGNFKGLLLELCQQNKWESPSFNAKNVGVAHLSVWDVDACMVVDGKEYSAAGRNAVKKQAEQQASHELLSQVRGLTRPKVAEVSVLTKNSDAKSVLNLMSQKVSVASPSYKTNIEQEQPPMFVAVCKFEVNGVKYEKKGGPHSTKKKAEQSAAEEVVKALEAA